MTNLTIPNTFVDGEPGFAADVNENFEAIRTLVNTTGIPKAQTGAITESMLAANVGSGVGLFGARPAAAAVRAGYMYFATDVNSGTLYRSNGTSWVQIATSLGGSAVVGDSSITTAKIVDEAVTSEKLDPVTNGIYNVMSYGATGDGSTDDTTAVQAAFAAANAAGGTVVFPAGTYVLTDTLDWHASDFSVKGYSAKLDFTTTSVSPAISVTGSGDTGSGGSDFFEDFKHTFEGFDILGPDVDATIIDCIHLSDTTNGLAGCEFRSLHIEGFRDQVWTGNFNWAVRFHGIMFRNFHRYGAYLIPGGGIPGGGTAGELYQFYGCTWGNGRNAVSGTATAVYADGEGFLDAAFFGCSFDYQDIELVQRCGRLLFSGCHWENNNADEAMFQIESVSGQRSPVLNIIGGTINPEETGSRDYLFTYTQGTGASIDVLRMGVFYGFDQRTTKIDHLTDPPANESPKVREIGSAYQISQGANAAIVGSLNNRIYNGGFELNNTNGWTVVAGGSNTWDTQSSQKVSGSYGGRVAGSSGSGFSRLYQQVTCRPGETAFFSAQLKPSITSGSIVARLRFLAADGTTTISTKDQTTLTSASASTWTKAAGDYLVPEGAAFVRLEFTVDSFNGTVYLDDCVMATA